MLCLHNSRPVVVKWTVADEVWDPCAGGHVIESHSSSSGHEDNTILEGYVCHSAQGAIFKTT